MWPFSKAAKKADLQGWRTVRINGWKFTIRRLNPILDFPPDRMPKLFGEFVSVRRPVLGSVVQMDEKQSMEDLKLTIAKGTVSPAIGLTDKDKADFTADDLLRDGDTAVKLYIEIMTHSLNMLRGLRGVFFCLRIRHLLYTALRKNTGLDLHRSPSGTVPVH